MFRINKAFYRPIYSDTNECSQSEICFAIMLRKAKQSAFVSYTSSVMRDGVSGVPFSAAGLPHGTKLLLKPYNLAPVSGNMNMKSKYIL